MRPENGVPDSVRLTIGTELRQCLRMLARDWRSGELRLLALAVVLAVSATSAVGFLAERVRDGMQRDAAQFLGGDVAVQSDRPFDPRWEQWARAAGLHSARAASFPSMALAGAEGDESVLVGVKAVSDEYPLRGAVRLEAGADLRGAGSAPAPGSVWVDPGVLAALAVQRGDAMQLGRLRLRIAAVISAEPDRALQVLGFAPRVLINMADLKATGLVQEGSRVAYRWMAAGDRTAVRALVERLRPTLQRGQRLDSIEDARPDLQKNLERAERYLGLVALLTVLISALAAGNAARRFAARRLDACALLRSLGVTQGRLLFLYGGEFLIVALLASLVGVLLALGLHLVLLRLLGDLVRGDLAPPGLLPAVQGICCGLVLVLGFGLPPIERLRRVSALRVLRRDWGEPGARLLLSYGAGAAAFALLLLWMARDARLALVAGLGFAAAVVVFAACARAALGALRGVRAVRVLEARGLAWRFALAALQRRGSASVAQLVALALGLMVLLVLAIVRTDLVDQWRGQVPPDAPNRFLINIQADEVDGVRARLRAAGVRDVVLEPMVRGRLVAIDGRAAGPEDYSDDRSRALVEREFNLSYRADAPAHNTLVQGRWFARPDAPELSIEEGIARRLGIGLGQRLRFDVAGVPVEATVTSVRKVVWDSMRVNFFVIFAPELLRDAPQSWITSFRLAPQQAGLPAELVRAYPNLTFIDTEQVLAQLRATLDELIGAAQFLFAFALAAGVLVLYTALAASQDARVHEVALLRALGATRAQLARAQWAELLLLGGVAGALAALGAVLAAWALAHFVFEFDYAPRAWVAVAGVGGGLGASALAGWSGTRHVLRTPPLASLREV